MTDEGLLKSEERAVYALRRLYRRYGYLPYKMSKFEEYELYVQNKDFLVSDRVIPFTDTNGRLMALKPDVTLSIVKNGEDRPGCKQKLSYNENVYRVDRKSGQYRELMQAGLECIGDLDGYDLFEAVSLAAKSLALLSPDYVLELSHLGLLNAFLEEAAGDETLRRRLAALVAEKNLHDLRRLCRASGVSAGAEERLCALAGLSGSPAEVLPRLRALCGGAGTEALEELRALWALLGREEGAERIRLDLSLVSDMNYYNGLVFKGFLNGVYESVLSGGQYDKLLWKLGRSSRAVGFAIYLNLLEELERRPRELDADVLLLYSPGADPAAVAAEVRRLTEAGKSVSAQKAVPPRFRYGELVRLEEESPC